LGTAQSQEEYGASQKSASMTGRGARGEGGGRRTREGLEGGGKESVAQRVRNAVHARRVAKG